MRLCASMDTPSPLVSTRRSSVSSRRKRSCHSKSGVRQTQTHFHTQQQHDLCAWNWILFSSNGINHDFNYFFSPSVQMWGWSQWKGKIINMLPFEWWNWERCAEMTVSFVFIYFVSSSDEPLKWQFVDQFVSESGVRDGLTFFFMAFFPFQAVSHRQTG